MTRAALAALPEGERRFVGPRAGGLFDDACLFPDAYFDIRNGGHERAAPYALLIDGIQFHYIPSTPIEPAYKYWRVVHGPGGRPCRLERLPEGANPNWEHSSRAFRHYLGRSIEALRAGRLEDFAGFAGTLLHAVEDGGYQLHSLEGTDGTDVFVLDRMVEPPGGDFALVPSWTMRATPPPRCAVGRRPRLLGTSADEAAFLLYSRFFDVQSASRRSMIPLLFDRYAGRTTAVAARLDAMASAAAGLCADILHTVICAARGRFPAGERRALERTFVSDLKPVREPRGLSLPYHFLSMTRDRALDERRRPHPLRLLVRSPGGTVRRVFRKGLATGSHFRYEIAYELPAGVYERFRCTAGLHADLGLHGDLTLSVRVRGRTVVRRRVNRAAPSFDVDVPVAAGGRLELVGESREGMGATNNIVWGEPVLLKAPAAP